MNLYIFLKMLLFQSGAIKIKDLSIPELIGIMDTSLACLVGIVI